MSSRLRYALVTPARNEALNLRRLAKAVERQTTVPQQWVIVDNGSTDETALIAQELAQRRSWISFLSIEGEAAVTRGGPVARAFAAGLTRIPDVDVIVKLDADVSFADDYFERMLLRFGEDARLGMASGTCYEHDGGAWRPVYTTRDHVRGAVRAYRSACLADVSPLEERMGWDTIDELKARLSGWRTQSFGDLPFFHHRSVGERDGATRAWVAQGDLAHYLSYRPSYLLGRILFRALREPAAVAMLWGYAAAMARRRPRYEDDAVRTVLRQEQRLRNLRARAREARGGMTSAPNLRVQPERVRADR